MDIAINHASFQQRHLALRPAGFFRGPRLLQNNGELTGKKGRYEVQDDSGRARVVEVKGRFLDPLPKVTVDGADYELARPLAWYEYAWMGFPIVLVFIGGAIGGGVGFAAAYSSARVFRSERSAVVKYLLTGGISIAAVVVWVVLAGLLQIALGLA